MQDISVQNAALEYMAPQWKLIVDNLSRTY